MHWSRRAPGESRAAAPGEGQPAGGGAAGRLLPVPFCGFQGRRAGAGRCRSRGRLQGHPRAPPRVRAALTATLSRAQNGVDVTPGASSPGRRQVSVSGLHRFHPQTRLTTHVLGPRAPDPQVRGGYALAPSAHPRSHSWTVVTHSLKVPGTQGTRIRLAQRCPPRRGQRGNVAVSPAGHRASRWGLSSRIRLDPLLHPPLPPRGVGGRLTTGSLARSSCPK